MGKWKIVRNDQSIFKDVKYAGTCPRFQREASVEGHYHGQTWAKTDLQPTYMRERYHCSLLSGTPEDGCCYFVREGKCPIIPDEYL